MLARIINTTQRAAKMSPEEKVKFLKAAWDAIGSEFGSRHTQYEMFYAGARFVTTGHSYRTFDWAGATGMVDDLMSSYQLADELGAARADMKVAIVNLGQIVSGNWRDPFAAGDTIITEGERIVSVGTASAGAVESADVVIDAGGMTAIPGLIDSPRAHHVRRLHAAPAHRRLSRKLPARRHHDRDLGLRGARAGPAARRRGRQGAGGRGAALLRGLPAGRHARHRRLGDPRAGPAGGGLPRAGAEGRAARQGRLRRGEDRLRLRADGGGRARPPG